MSSLTDLLAREPVRVRVYGALAALLPLLAAFGLPVTEGQTAAVLAFAYVLLIGGTEWARAKVTPTP